MIPEIISEYVRYQRLDSKTNEQTTLTPDDLQLEKERDLALILDFLNRDEKHMMKHEDPSESPKQSFTRALDVSIGSEVEMSLARQRLTPYTPE
jgi:hypothetical protein